MTQPVGNNGNVDASTGTGVLNDVWDEFNHQFRVSNATGIPASQILPRTVTFNSGTGTGAIGPVPLFTVTGSVLVAVVAYVGTTVVGTSGTIETGVTGLLAALQPSLTATTLVAGKGWDSTGLVAAGTALATTPKYYLSNQNIISTIATTALSAGVLNYVCYWVPLSYGASITLS